MPDPEARAQRLVRFLGGWPSYLRCGDATARCAAAAVATLESALESATAGAGGGGGTAEERRERRRLARGATASAPAGRRRCVSERRRRTGTGACAYVLDTLNWGDGVRLRIWRRCRRIQLHIALGLAQGWLGVDGCAKGGRGT